MYCITLNQNVSRCTYRYTNIYFLLWCTHKQTKSWIYLLLSHMTAISVFGSTTVYGRNNTWITILLTFRFSALVDRLANRRLWDCTIRLYVYVFTFVFDAMRFNVFATITRYRSNSHLVRSSTTHGPCTVLYVIPW